MKRRVQYGAISFLLTCSLSGCGVETEEPSFANPLDPAQGSGLPIPEGILVAVGDNAVELTWSLPEGETADDYAIFRRQTVPAVEESERLIDRVTIAIYHDSGARNGSAYAYRLAAGRAGQFGERTAELIATPGLFTIVIADEDRVTRDRTVSVNFYAPSATALQLSEDANSFAGPWYPATGAVPWRLSSGDGAKTLYGRFRLSDGSESLPVFDTIKLDTQATITAIEFEGATTRAPGDQILFTLVAGETQGAALVTVDGVFYGVPLFDDGSHGDSVAEDGTYARELVIPTSSQTLNENVIGEFTDAAGNVATSWTAARLLTVRDAPPPVHLHDPHMAEPPDDAAVALQWTLVEAEDFSAYRIFRSETTPVDSSALLIETISSSLTVAYEDRDVIEGVTHYYRIYVRDGYGAETGSNTATAAVPNLRAPHPVTIQSQQAASTSRITLEWSQSPDADFKAYHVYRNTTGAVTGEDDLVAEIEDIAETYHDDADLRENTLYYYRVFTIDQAGLSARSNEVSAQTRNAAPPAVVLNAASAIDSTSAEISWAASAAHDFDVYRLYRAEIATVTTTADLVAELDDATFTAYHDTALDPGTHYYYRVFVVDDASEPKAVGSNTIDFTTLASSGGTP